MLDIFAQTSVDYYKNGESAKTFFKTIQNKLLYAETGQTAAELIIDRADGNAPNMGLTSFKGDVVRKGDIETTKNYLNEDEISHLNRLVGMFLDFAEDRANRRQEITMKDWLVYSEDFLKFNERNVLEGPGTRSNEAMSSYVEKQYQIFDNNRKIVEHQESEKQFLKDTEDLMKVASLKKK